MKSARPGNSSWKKARIAARIAILPAAIFLGLILGLYLDKILSIPPAFTLLLIIIGIVAGCLGTLKINIGKEV